MIAFVKESAKSKVKWASPQGRLEKPRSFFDMELALRAAIETRMTGRVPTPEETAQKSLAWYADVNLQLDWIQFHEDQEEPADSNGHH